MSNSRRASPETDEATLTALRGDGFILPSSPGSSASTPLTTMTFSSARAPPMQGSPYSGRMLTQQTGYLYKGPAKMLADDAIPSRHELFILGDGEKKVEVKVDTRVPSAAVFTFNKEDHTLGNVLRSRLLQSPNVLFAAYKVPHPLFPTFELRVQTNGDVTPTEAVIAACEDLVKDLGKLGRQFTTEWELRKMVGEKPQQNGN